MTYVIWSGRRKRAGYLDLFGVWATGKTERWSVGLALRGTINPLTLRPPTIMAGGQEMETTTKKKRAPPRRTFSYRRGKGADEIKPDDLAVMVTACQRRGHALFHASDALKNNKELVLCAV